MAIVLDFIVIFIYLSSDYMINEEYVVSVMLKYLSEYTLYDLLINQENEVLDMHKEMLQWNQIIDYFLLRSVQDLVSVIKN